MSDWQKSISLLEHTVAYSAGSRFFDLWHKTELEYYYLIVQIFLFGYSYYSTRESRLLEFCTIGMFFIGIKLQNQLSSRPSSEIVQLLSSKVLRRPLASSTEPLVSCLQFESRSSPVWRNERSHWLCKTQNRSTSTSWSACRWKP